jgi:hypothetical protein
LGLGAAGYLLRCLLLEEGTKLLISGRFEYNGFLKGDGTGSYYHLSQVHEAYASLSYQNLDLNLGQKKISWGKADLSIVDSVNPPDLTELYFIEEEFSKVPVPMAQVNYFSGDFKVEGVFLPFFTPARFTIAGRNWSLISPQLQDLFAGCGAGEAGEELLGGDYTALGKIEYPKSGTLTGWA